MGVGGSQTQFSQDGMTLMSTRFSLQYPVFMQACVSTGPKTRAKKQASTTLTWAVDNQTYKKDIKKPAMFPNPKL